MFNKLILIIATLILAGCANTHNIPLQADAFAVNPPETLATTNREKPDFAAMTSTKGAFALIGAFAAISAGNELVEENQIEDPAVYIRQSLKESLQQQMSLTPIDQSELVLDSEKTEEIAKHYPAADLVLDIQTYNWSFLYFPTSWDTYHVIYSAKLRLIDTRNSKLVAEGFCIRNPEQDENSPSYAELVANSAKRLKSELQLAADHCVEEFKTKVLNI
ncbi:hypothetical protein DV711_00145 [Motiliproteus coralliicola]|uniref:Lipoprotein n=1 Tax=Motiliproteus coralliicola TaxID=2283196 RepID=A0A369WU32_9GAMM|nr:hypothetical protein [Motiliproteus coralliicola]RDE24056.1 hypothetical protein DV711_00145 [Motiliproteus coralliicola]